MEAVHRQYFVRPDDRHRHDVRFRLDRHVACARHERLHLSRRRAPALRKHHQRRSIFQVRHCPQQAAHGAQLVPRRDRHLPRPPQMPAHERIAKQLFFRDDAELPRHARVQDWNVERGNVVGREHMRVRPINLVQPAYPGRRPYGMQDQPRPQPCEPVLDAPIAVPQRRQQRHRPQHDRVQVDKRVEEEDRPQPAHRIPESASHGRS